jgi:monoamine oxidase
MAASVLAKKKHEVIVIEARDRIGGRIHTQQSKFTLPVELGAEFMHGKQPLTNSLIRESKSEVFLLAGHRYQLWDGHWQRGDFFDSQWEELTKALKQLKTDTDIETFLNNKFNKEAYADLHKKVKGFVEGYDAAEMGRVSAIALREEWEHSDDEHQYHIRGGYSGLMYHLEDEVKKRGGSILLSSAVREVHWSAGKVKVITEEGRELEGDRVIITIPLGVLQKGAVTFVPPLPDHTNAFTQIGFGGVIKFFFEFHNPFWEQVSRPLKDLAFVFSDAAIPTWWSQLPDRTPMLTGWLGGPATSQMSSDPEVLFEKAVLSLQYIFNCSSAEVKSQIKEWQIANWVEDPFAMGAYAYPTIETQRAREFLAAPIKNTIYFAGEALYKGAAMGTVEAALVSGKEVASQLMP